MQNVLSHVSDRSSHLTGKRRIFFNFQRSVNFGPWRLYRPRLRRHSWRICFVYICWSESWSDLVWYLGLSDRQSDPEHHCWTFVGFYALNWSVRPQSPPRCCHLGSYFKRLKSSAVRPLACNGYYRARFIAMSKLGGDVDQPWLMSKYDVVHKTGST